MNHNSDLNPSDPNPDDLNQNEPNQSEGRHHRLVDGSELRGVGMGFYGGA